MSDPDDINGYESIAHAANRIAGLAREIERAHGMGHPPGPHDQPWSLAAQSDAAAVYARSLPVGYQRDLASQFAEIGRSMARLASPPDAETAWHTVATYLHSTATAIHLHDDPVDDPGTERCAGATLVADITRPTPAVLRFDQLARLYSHKGVTELVAAATTVATACAAVSRSCVLSTEEQAWVQSLIDGDTEQVIANAHGLSRRTLHRRLDQLWTRIGAANRTHGISICSANGWLD